MTIPQFRNIYQSNPLNGILNIRGGSKSPNGLPFINKNPLRYFPSSTTSGVVPTITTSTSNCDGISLLPFIIIPTLPQIMISIITSFTIAEILNYCGLFQDENGQQAKQRAIAFFDTSNDTNTQNNMDDIDSTTALINKLTSGIYHWVEGNIKYYVIDGNIFHLNLLSSFQTKVDNLLNYGVGNGSTDKGTKSSRGQDWNSTIRQMAFKTQFAIGSALGMILHSSSILVAKVGIITYLLSEISYNFVVNYEKQQKKEGEDSEEQPYLYEELRDFFQDDEKTDLVFDAVHQVRHLIFRCLRFWNRKFNGLRLKIRSFISNPQESLHQIFDGTWMDQDGTIIAGFVFGIVLGHLSS
jgi:hypothetical protein